MKRLFFSVLMVLAIVPMLFAAANSGNCGPVANGVFSNTCTWKIDTVMHYQYGRCPRLTISGTGSTADFSLLDPQPWWENAENIKLVVIEPGVTRLGDLTCYEMKSLREIALGSVEELGRAAFHGCSALTTVNLPATVQRIGENVFALCSSLTSINAANSTSFYSDNGVLYTYDKRELICFPTAAAITDYTVLPEATVLRQSAFDDATKLQKLRLHKDIRDYRKESLGCVGTSSLTDLYTPFQPVASMPLDAFSSFAQKSTVTLHVPSNLRNAYQAATVWKDFNIVNDQPNYYTDCIFINGQYCVPDADGYVSSPKITAGTVQYRNKVLTLDNAVVDAPIEADVLFLSVAGECAISGYDNNALHLHTEGMIKAVVIYGASEEAQLTLYANPVHDAFKPAGIYTEGTILNLYNRLSGSENSLGITIETTRTGIDAASACEVVLDKSLLFLRIRPTVTPAFYARCYSDNITFSATGSALSSDKVLSDEIDDENGYCLWEQVNPEGIEDVQGDNVQSTKVIRDGQLYLMYEGRMYDVQGRNINE